MANRRKRLRNLLLTLFRGNDDLYEVIDTVNEGQSVFLLAGLPGVNVSRIAFTLAAVEQLEAFGLVKQPLFDLLAARFPARSALVRSAQVVWLDPATPDEEELEPSPTGDTTAVAAADIATHEKIMGERPTFLDVAYLKSGYEAARGVVKLRMRFADGWYTGTGFLISPTRLLTAHHNMQQTTGEKVLEVQALFDYERALSGPAAEGTEVPCELETIRGEAADDWAVIDLTGPAVDAIPLLLSETPAALKDRVAIIQHPNGMAKQVALHSNLVTFANDARVQYLTDTLPGSSGAPVFNTDWQVVAVHHAGGDLEVPGSKDLVYRNQGTPIGRIKARIAALDNGG